MSKNPEWETPVVGQTDWTAEIPPSSTFTEEQLAATNEAKLYRDEAEAFKNQSQAISADISVKYDDIIVRFAEFEVVAENLQNQINQVNAAVEDASDSAAAAQASASAASGAQAGAETAQAAAQTAQTGAETARADAQTARTQAQTARTDAQTARNASQAAQSASEGARDASVTARNASQAAQTAAETARGNAETFANNASGSATASDTARQASQTARDQAQTARTDAQSARDTALGYRDAAQTARDEAVAAAEGINPDQFLLRSGGEMTGRLRNTFNPTGQAGLYPIDLVNNANQGASGSTWRDASLINLDNFSPAIRFRDRTTGAASLIMGVDGNQLQFWSEDDAGALVKRGYFSLANGQFFQGTTRLAPVASPPLTGTPTAPTAAKGTNTTQIATMAAIIEALADYYTAAQLDVRQWGSANLADSAVSGQKVADGGIASEAKLWATARKDLSDRVLIGKWSGTELGGLTQILLDLPAEFENFQLLESNIRSTNTSAALILRIGPTAGGAVDQGANDYANILMGYSGGGSGVSLSYASANWAFVRPISTQAGKSITDFSDGSWGIGWSGLSTSIYYDVAATRDNLVQRGHRRNANTGRTNRLQIGFNAALVNGGAIRLYGIK